MVATVFMLFLTVSEQKSKLRLTSEIFKFSYLALGQIRKLGNVGKIFLSFKTDLNFLAKCDLPCRIVITVFKFLLTVSEQKSKVPVKLIQRVKIAHSFLQSMSNLFQFIILSLTMYFYIWLSKNFLKSTSKNREIGLSLIIPSNMKSTLRIFIHA